MSPRGLRTTTGELRSGRPLAAARLLPHQRVALRSESRARSRPGGAAASWRDGLRRCAATTRLCLRPARTTSGLPGSQSPERRAPLVRRNARRPRVASLPILQVRPGKKRSGRPSRTARSRVARRPDWDAGGTPTIRRARLAAAAAYAATPPTRRAATRVAQAARMMIRRVRAARWQGMQRAGLSSRQLREVSRRRLRPSQRIGQGRRLRVRRSKAARVTLTWLQPLRPLPVSCRCPP